MIHAETTIPTAPIPHVVLIVTVTLFSGLVGAYCFVKSHDEKSDTTAGRRDVRRTGPDRDLRVRQQDHRTGGLIVLFSVGSISKRPWRYDNLINNI